MNISQAIASRIMEVLKEKKMTQYRLAKNAGLSQETIKSIMKGKAKGVNLKTVILIAYGFDMHVDEFLNSPMFYYNNLDID